MNRNLLKKVAVAVLILTLLTVSGYFIFFHFDKLNYDVDDISYVELRLDSGFDTTKVTDKGDIEALLESVNRCTAAGPHISLPKAGAWIYNIRFYFDDGEIEDFSFIPVETNLETRISKMSKLGRPGKGDGYFKGTLVLDFHELSVRLNPTKGNLEWYNAVIHPAGVK